jgi:hypothetical protein
MCEMRLQVKQIVIGLAICAMAAPVWAKTKTVDLQITEPSKVGSTQLAPGDYQFRAKEQGNQVDVLRNGKIIAEVPCHWVQLDKKSDQSSVLLDGNTVTELDFDGSNQAARF